MRARRARVDLQDYANQRYIAHHLNTEYFKALIDHCSILYSDGLDAIDTLPCGSMTANGVYFDRTVIERGITLKEHERREEIMRKIMEDIPLDD